MNRRLAAKLEAANTDDAIDVTDLPRSPTGREPDDYDRHVGRRLRAAREQAGLSGRQAARQLGVSGALISQQEQGQARVHASLIWRAAQLYEISVEYLFEGLQKPAAGATQQSRGKGA